MAGDVFDSGRLGREVELLRQRVRELESESLDIAGALAEAEAKLREGQEDSRTLLESLPEMVCRIRPDGTYVYVSRACTRLFGYLPEEMVGRKACDFIHPEDISGVIEARRRAFETGEPRASEYRHLAKDSACVWVETTGCVIAGRPTDTKEDMICVVRDVAERRRVEERLHESEERYRSLVTALMDAVLLTAPEGRILSANETACRMFGYSEAELIEGGRSAVVDETDPRLAPALAERARTGRFRGELTFVRKDGTKFPGEISSAVFATPQGEVRTSMVIRDITERRQAEETLRKSEERYRAVVEDQTEMICRFRADGTFTFANDVYCRFSGKTAAELIGNRWQPVVIPEDLPHVEAELRTLAASNPVVVIESRVLSGGAEEHWMQFVNRGFFDAEGRLTEIQAVGRDISERKKTEELLRQANSYTRSLIEASVDALVAIGPDGTITDVNHATEEVTGLVRDALVGTDFSSYFTDPQRARAGYEQVFREGKVRDYALSLRHRDGRITPVVYDASLYRDGSGQVIGVFAGAWDVTERKRMEEALLAYQKQLQSLASELVQSEDRERRRIAAYLHDEVGQSLAAVRVKFAAWKRMEPSPRREKLLAEIEQLIDRSIEETRSLTFELSPPVLHELGLGPALEWLGEALCEKEGIACTFLDDGQSGKLDEVLANTLYRVARELLLNALKHAQPKHVSVSVRADGGELRLVVDDDGIGMERSRYEQALRGAGGTYGLFSIRERLEHLGGSLDIESNPGEGTRVTVAAPLGRTVSSQQGD